MTKKISVKSILSLLLAAAMLFSLAACGSKTEPEVSLPEPSPEVTPEPTAEPTPEPTPVPETPETRAAALGLPAPPDVDITSWEFELANSYNSIGEHVPPYGGIEGQGLHANAVQPTYELLQAARGQGYQMYLAVAFRNFEYLLTHYENAILTAGSAYEAVKFYLPPGCSEHQTGLAIDITNDYTMATNYNEFKDPEVKESDTYAWMLEHCAEYGFILRYPEGKEAYYGTPCSHAHFRYVGKEAAKYIMDNGLCLEEFLLLYDEDAVYVPEQIQ